MKQTREEEYYGGQLSPVNALLVGAVVIVFLILFCVVVWSVTHRTRKENVEPSVGSFAESIENKDEILDVPTPTPEPSDESESLPEGNDLGMDFEEVADRVTAKDVTNLRSEPSTDGGADTVVFKLNHGDIVDRIGMCEASGWSKLYVNGEIVYAVTTYLEVVTDVTTQ